MIYPRKNGKNSKSTTPGSAETETNLDFQKKMGAPVSNPPTLAVACQMFHVLARPMQDRDKLERLERSRRSLVRRGGGMAMGLKRMVAVVVVASVT